MNGQVRAVYAQYDEGARLAGVSGRLEWVRTRELLSRHLPAAPALVLDVGGGTGHYARDLTDQGYDTVLVDLVAGHVRQAAEAGSTGVVADAVALPLRAGCADAVLLLGPLYHLPDPGQRVRALREAVRVLRPGGLLAAAGMSRHAKPVARAAAGRLGEPGMARHLAAILRDGHDPHRGGWDACSYNHTPGELSEELRAAGFDQVEVYGIEGPLGPWARADPQLLDLAVQVARDAERDAAGQSIHLLAVGRSAGKP